jgi:hypothetical protein
MVVPPSKGVLTLVMLVSLARRGVAPDQRVQRQARMPVDRDAAFDWPRMPGRLAPTQDHCRPLRHADWHGAFH